MEREYSKEELTARVGSIAQLAGYKRYRLEEGRSRGVEAVDIWNGSGLELTIVCDRGSDMASLRHRGRSLCWISNLGISAPAYWQEGEWTWNHNFGGGMLATCGLTTAGLPSCDQGEQLPLHGHISNTPSQQVCCKGAWEADGYWLTYQATTVQARPFGETLEMERRIRIRMGDDRVYLQDTVRNVGPKSTPFMLLYHMNFGYPLLDEGAELYLTYDDCFPTSPLAEQQRDTLGVITGPQNDYVPRAYNWTMAPDEQGWGHAALLNPAIGLAATLDFDTATLPLFNLWKCLQTQNYVLGLEPCNCRTWGRERARQEAALQFLEPGEERRMQVILTVHDGPEALDKVRVMGRRL